MPRSGTRLRAAVLGDTDERPCCLGCATRVSQVAPPTAGLGQKASAARLGGDHRAVASRVRDFTRETPIGIGRCVTTLVLEDGSTSLGGFFVCHVLNDLGVEDRHQALQAVADGRYDALRVRVVRVDHRQQDTVDRQSRVELLAHGADGLEDLRQSLDGQEIGLDGDDDAV